jgi:galactokinase
MQPKHFEEVFGHPPEAVAEAPGRVNLLGEHTDYNEGFVLPIAIAQRTRVALRRRSAAGCVLYAANFDRRLELSLASPPEEHFATYVYGCLAEASAAGARVPPLEIHVSSDVPIGIGLSSSAALEVAVLRALRELLGLAFDDIRIAQLARAAEVKYAGVDCGIMDQMAASLADTSLALFLDTRTLETRLLPLPADTAVLVLDSGVARSLAGSAYNDRRAECTAAARLLGIGALRDVADTAATDALPEPLRRRARHVVTENARVLRTLAGLDAAAFGALMNASHASLRDDFEVSIPALDTLVALLQAHPRVYGARLTGAGFGGACVALCDPQGLAETAAEVLDAYARAGFSGGRQVVP